MSPDGEAIVTGAGDETLRFWNVFSKTRSTKVRMHCVDGCSCVLQEAQPLGVNSVQVCSAALPLISSPYPADQGVDAAKG